MSVKPVLFGLMAEFDTPEALLRAAKRAHDEGYRQLDAYSPFPVEGIDEAIGCEREQIAWRMLAGGLCGGIIAYTLQYWAMVYSYAINVGGRPYHSWPSFVPVTFELTVLFSALTGLISMLSLNRLPQPYHPVFNHPGFTRASSDRFFLCIEASDPRFDRDSTARLLREASPLEVAEVMA